ncbi:MAG: hypothetical protein HUJ91_06045 [Bacteroidales bacterium]|nr:hypothetical protein [Bacteroidales bacterium]
MLKRSGHIAIWTVLALAMTSCTYFSGGDRLARVGKDILYMEDVQKLLPEGISSEDSAAMVRRYIDSWALARLKVLKTGDFLSKEERDVKDEVNAYRLNLLGYKYEKYYLESHIDTLVTPEDALDYYEAHKQSYCHPYIVAKARVITISTTSPNYKEIEKTYRETDSLKVEELRELCMLHAEKYEEFGGNWMAMPSIARTIPGLDAESCENIFFSSDHYVKKAEGKDYFIFLTDKIAAGKVAPFKFCEKSVKEAVINKRKQELFQKMEQELLEEATANEQLKIYTNE